MAQAEPPERLELVGEHNGGSGGEERNVWGSTRGAGCPRHPRTRSQAPSLAIARLASASWRCPMRASSFYPSITHDVALAAAQRSSRAHGGGGGLRAEVRMSTGMDIAICSTVRVLRSLSLYSLILHMSLILQANAAN